MKTLRDYINLIESAEQGAAEGSKSRTCPQCDGSGEDSLHRGNPCERCNGKGHIPANKEQGVAESEAAARMGLMSAVGSDTNDPTEQRRKMAQQTVERMQDK